VSRVKSDVLYRCRRRRSDEPRRRWPLVR
jgi:hypothetical protein